MIQVYVVQLQDKLHIEERRRLEQWVTPERRKKAERLRQEADQVRSLTAGALLKWGLLRNGVDGGQEVQLGPMGKPMLPGIEFNISHAGSFVAMAVGRQPVGIDVEGGREPSEKVATRFHPEEIARYKAVAPEEKTSQFCRIWTAKESVMKRDGRGLAMNMASFSIFSDELKKELYSVQLTLEYWLSVCSRESWDGKVQYLSLETILE